MTPPLHPAHCRCRRCEPPGPAVDAGAHVLAAAALAIGAALLLVLALWLGTCVRAELLTLTAL